MNRLAIVRLDLSQREVADVADISQTFFSKLERGDASPTIEVARRVAAALGKSVDHLWPPSSHRRCESAKATK